MSVLTGRTQLQMFWVVFLGSKFCCKLVVVVFVFISLSCVAECHSGKLDANHSGGQIIMLLHLGCFAEILLSLDALP